MEKKLTKTDLDIEDYNFRTETLGVGTADIGEFACSHNFDMDVYLPDYDANLQRGLCWNKEQNQALVLSILRGIWVPPVTCVYSDGQQSPPIRQVIDGKQRLNAIFRFLRGELALEMKGVKYFYQDMDSQLHLMFAEHLPLVYVCTDTLTDQQKVRLFLALNFRGVPQNDEYLFRLENMIK